jgi:class 3 adenylate cyclase/Tfp pilus assembly protein PilF
MKKISTLIIFCGITLSLKAQVNTDSLRKLWNDMAQADTVRLYAIEELAWDAMYKNTDSAIVFANLELEYAKRKNQKLWQAKACNTLGVAWYIKSNYSKAIEWHQQSFAIWKEMNEKTGMASSYNNLGNIYSEQSDYIKALESYQKALDLIESSNKKKAGIYYSNIGSIYLYQGIHTKALEQFQKALSLSEELNDKDGMAVAYNNIGVIYNDVGNATKALEYYQKSIDINKELGDKQGLAESYINTGTIKKAQGDYVQALDYQQKSLGLEKELDNRQGIADVYGKIGEIYATQDNVPPALENFQKGLALAEELGNRDKIAYSYINIGSLYLKQKNYKRAEVLGKNALKLSEELGIITYQRDASKLLYEIYKAWGKNNDALSYHEKFLNLTDSIETTETNKKLDRMEFAKIIMEDSLKKEKEKVLVEMAHEEEVHQKDKQRNLAIYIGAGILLLAGALWGRLRYVRKTRAVIQKEKHRSENLLLNILPAEIAEELKQHGKAEARDFDLVSILFTDFKEFTSISEKMGAKELVAEINYCFEAFDQIAGKYKIEKIKTIGDSYMAAGGLPVPTPDSVKNTVLAALEMQTFIQKYQLQKESEKRPAFQMRVGIHTGPVVAGIVGVKKFQYDIWGDAVNTASRMESSGAVGYVNISQTTYELIKDDPMFHFQSRGKIVAKGKGEIGMYFVHLRQE